MPHYAHSKEKTPTEHWHRLDEHLRETATRARRFAEPWGAGDWAWNAGLWHDLGKFSADFQRKLTNDANAHVKVDHSTAGSIHAFQTLTEPGRIAVSIAIAGHHAGLPDLAARWKPRLANRHLLQAAWDNGATEFACKPEYTLPLPPFLTDGRIKEEQKRSLELWTRLLFSSLVDADFLNTEDFFDPAKKEKRAVVAELKPLWDKLERHLAEKTRSADDTNVNRARREILAACLETAKNPPGCFSLTAPTGAGKTLSGMGFALQHALHPGNDLRRVIVVLPFTSIIEQSAKTYRDVFGSDAVVEHHSNLDPENETRFNRLASENWDAPIIVTTTVQFFESLFANRSSACRKLHNIAKSVVILDEAQALPVGLLAPILDVLRELVRGYGISLLISTATQPAFRERQTLPWGFADMREIVPDPPKAFTQLRRVRLHWPDRLDQPTTWRALAAELSKLPSVLAIVHRRQDARDLTRLLPPDTIHLSASMCAAHRLATIQRIKALLITKQPVRVVSTQLVEAGVDIDFPVVYRALAGLDAIAQSAGRCNREGLLKDQEGRLMKGHCHVFVAPTKPPEGVLTQALAVTQTMWEGRNRALDPLTPGPFEEFFRSLYFGSQLDQKGVQALREGLNFEQVAAAFRMIEDDWRIPVVVPYGDALKRVEELKAAAEAVGFIPAEKLRALQPFTVNITPNEYDNLEKREHGAVDTIAETVRVILPYFRRVADQLPLYDERFGLIADGDLCRDPKTLMG